ncbi:VRR-NUC domain-containing protein [Terrihalobacillus insolitus]|uniref:VRR-NUC domain-containing protein n=1 Tax=Terrihalobacillus insolitus TaxID=2950438 RepID=UPI002340F6D8|nr:VRR-NUC domain-containing protein [Terrihalobacillus insolitus]MDC3412557.1 VRR-NUC domain-containing protein [Terrihalobacillus insolitus]
MSQGPEKRIENKIKQYLDNIGAWHIKTHGSMFSKAGTPDIIACVNGWFVAIEVKRPDGGVVSELQKYHIDAIRKAGGVAFVACSVLEVQRYLKEQSII